MGFIYESGVRAMNDPYYYLEKYFTRTAVIISTCKSLLYRRKPIHIGENIYFGGYKDALIHGREYDHIINLTGGKLRNTTHHVPMKDGFNQNSADKIGQAVSIAKALEGRVLIHCAAGMSRSGTVASVIKAFYEESELHETVEELKELGHIDPIDHLIEEAEKYFTWYEEKDN